MRTILFTLLLALCATDMRAQDTTEASPLTSAFNQKAYTETGDNGYLRLLKPLPISHFRVRADKQTGPDGTIYYTCVKMQSTEHPDVSIEYGFYMNNHHKGRLMINGNPVDGIGTVGDDGWISYDMQPYGPNLLITEVQGNFPCADFIFE